MVPDKTCLQPSAKKCEIEPFSGLSLDLILSKNEDVAFFSTEDIGVRWPSLIESSTGSANTNVLHCETAFCTMHLKHENKGVCWIRGSAVVLKF